MEKHIEKVRFKSPQKYQAMIQRAGENITQCTDGHKEVNKGMAHLQKTGEDLPNEKIGKI